MCNQNQKLNKKGFSLVELLFVMVILGGLMAIAIPNMSSNEESVKKLALVTDIREVNKIIIQEYMTNQSFNGSVGIYEDTDNNGISEVSMNGTPVHLSLGNIITVTTEDCGAGAGGGYKIVGAFGGLTKEFNSCTSSKID